MLFQTGPRALLGPTARVPGGSEPPGTASSDASELAVPGGTEPPGTAAQNRADLLFVLGGMCN